MCICTHTHTHTHTHTYIYIIKLSHCELRAITGFHCAQEFLLEIWYKSDIGISHP